MLINFDEKVIENGNFYDLLADKFDSKSSLYHIFKRIGTHYTDIKNEFLEIMETLDMGLIHY